MKTDDLIAMLATGVTPVDPQVSGKRFQLALGWGTLGAVALMLLGFGLNTLLPQAAAQPMFWVKLGFPAALAAAGLVLTVRLSHPGMRPGAAVFAVIAPVLGMALLALQAWTEAAPQDQPPLVLGTTWQSCSLSIALVSAPVFAGVFWAMKGLAPTRLALAGASAGLLAGAVGTFVYAFHCQEIAAPFLLVWYGIGMLIPTGIGAWLGPKLLRW